MIGSHIVEEVYDALAEVFDHSVLHDVVLGRLCATHLKDTSQFSLRLLSLFNHVHIGFLD